MDRKIEMEFPADLRTIAEARRSLEEFVRPCNLTATQIDDLKIALSEACTNAVCHGCHADPGKQIRVRLTASDGAIGIEVEDCGGGPIPERVTLPEPDELAVGGRGLFLMQALMDEVDFKRSARGTLVRLCMNREASTDACGFCPQA